MTNVLKVIKEPNEILRKISHEVDKNMLSSEAYKQLCLDMSKTMREKDGVGLAAPQIGENMRLIVVNTKDGTICMTNPKIVNKSWKKEWDEEGCLSVPNIFGKVKRHSKITCLYLNKNGKKMKMQAKGLMARIIQHEIDHLDGILFIDKAKDLREVVEEKILENEED